MRKKAPVNARNSGHTKSIAEVLRVLQQSLRSYLCHQGQEYGLNCQVSPYVEVRCVDSEAERENNLITMSKSDYPPSAGSSLETSNSRSSSVFCTKAPSSACFHFFLNEYMTNEENGEFTYRKFRNLFGGVMYVMMLPFKDEPSDGTNCVEYVFRK